MAVRVGDQTTDHRQTVLRFTLGHQADAMALSAGQPNNVASAATQIARPHRVTDDAAGLGDEVGLAYAAVIAGSRARRLSRGGGTK
jgi:hypothetical protein